MKKEGKNFIVNTDLYPFDIMFSFGQTDLSLCGNLKGSDATNSELMEIVSNKASNIINGKLLVIRYLESKPDPSKLAYDIFVVVCKIMKELKIEQVWPEKPAHAFLIGHITKKVYQEFGLLK